MRISIIGTGYVGLVTGVGLAAKGHTVIGVDARAEAVERIARGESPIHEPRLEAQLQKVLKNGSFSVTQNLADAIRQTELTFICVGTPSRPDGSIDLDAVRTVASQIGDLLRSKIGYHTVVVKSTVLPGTTESVVGRTIAERSGKQPGSGFGLAMNPEFLREGNAVGDFLEPDRIVIGSNDERSRAQLGSVYEKRFHAPIVQVNIPTAEMIKYTNNAFLALCISFSNEIAQVCERAGNTDDANGMDAVEVLQALVQDGRLTTRIGKGKTEKRIVPGIASYLFPGCGFGGSCFPKDLKALRQFARFNGKPAPLVEATFAVNESQIVETVAKAERILGSAQGKTIAILGTAFKPDTDDIRESPALKIIDRLLERGAMVRAYDPEAMENTRKVYGKRIAYAASALDALKNAELAIVVTRWEEFKRITPEEFRKAMRRAALIDCRRIYDRKRYANALEYHATGIANLYKNK